MSDKKSPFAQLKPINPLDGREINPTAALDPYFVLECYGPKQLTTALHAQSAANLHEAAEFIDEQHPGTLPGKNAKKAQLTAYILEHVGSPQR